MKFDYANARYAASGLTGLSLSDALKLWKTKYPSYEHFVKDGIKLNQNKSLTEFCDFVKEMWDDIVPISVEDAFRETNLERRRCYFDCIGVVKIFASMKPTLLDKQVIKKVRTRWDKDNKPYEYVFEDTYELYAIDAKKLFDGVASSRVSFLESNNTFFTAVRCWCTTTNREYWIYVPEDECMLDNARAWNTPFDKRKYDAVKAIAWTIRIGITNPKRIFRQGDIVVAEASDNSVECRDYHLSKEDYLNLMYSES